MQRRDFLGLAGMAALSVARPGHAQPKPEVPLVGLLVPRKQAPANDALAALRAGLKEAGLVEGANYSLAMRFADGDLDRLPSLARELGALKPRVIVASSTAARTVRTELPDIPLVFTSISVDPVAYGYAQSYVRPGGLITGNVTNAMGSEEGLTEKRMDYLKELVPGLTRLGMIGPKGILYKAEMIALHKVSGQLGFAVTEYPINTLGDLEGAFADGVRDAVSAFYISGEPLLFNNMARVMSLVAASGKPCVGVYPEFGRAGLLMSYASDTIDGFRHAGTYVAKILRGAKPGDLPVEQASKFTLVINLKTAKALGIAVSPTLLALADEVIE